MVAEFVGGFLRGEAGEIDGGNLNLGINGVGEGKIVEGKESGGEEKEKSEREEEKGGFCKAVKRTEKAGERFGDGGEVEDE